jgi:hypothetical protein
VDRGDDDVESGEEVLVPVDGPVGLDVQLGAVEQRHAGGAGQLVQPLALLEGLLVETGDIEVVAGDGLAAYS